MIYTEVVGSNPTMHFYAIRVISIPLTTTAGTDTDSVSVNGNRMYYCWSHGLGSLPAHTGQNCCSLHEGHIATATAFKSQGGSNIFSTRENHPERNQRRTNN